MRAGAAAVRGGRPAAGRREVLACPLDPILAGELLGVMRLGERVIVRSSSPLERDPRWSGAFSSLAEVGPGDVATAVRSCWASAFAVDPLQRLGACGLPLEALELGILIQPEIQPTAGGVARVVSAAGIPAPVQRGEGRGVGCPPGHVPPPGPTAAGGVEVIVEGIAGHPGPLLSGWAEGVTEAVCLPPAPSSPLADLIGGGTVAAVARLAKRACAILGDDTIEWAACDGKIWLLQTTCSAGDPVAGNSSGTSEPGPPSPSAHLPGTAGTRSGLPDEPGLAPLPGSRERMPLLAVAVQSRGQHVPAKPAAPGTAAGRLVACRPHETAPGDCRDAILLVDRPVPALAPLLFAARGVVARSGASSSHLAAVARSLGVPMVTGCRTETVTGSAAPAGGWLAAIDGTTGTAALLRDPARPPAPVAADLRCQAPVS